MLSEARYAVMELDVPLSCLVRVPRRLVVGSIVSVFLPYIVMRYRISHLSGMANVHSQAFFFYFTFSPFKVVYSIRASSPRKK